MTVSLVGVLSSGLLAMAMDCGDNVSDCHRYRHRGDREKVRSDSIRAGDNQLIHAARCSIWLHCIVPGGDNVVDDDCDGDGTALLVRR